MTYRMIPSSLVAAAVLPLLLLVLPAPASAQDIAGEYQVEVRGTTYYLDREPASRQIRANATLTVEQSGDRVTIDFGSFASAMSATRFQGRIGNDRFTAVWVHPSADGQLRVITGTVDGNRLRGRLVYPRATADAGVPGWTEVEFTAVGRQGQAGQSTRVPPGRGRVIGDQQRSPVVRPLPGAAGEAAAGTFAVSVDAITDPEAPTAGHQIAFLAAGRPADRGETIGRMELSINGSVQGSSAGNRMEVTAGPFPAGRVDYEVVAISADGTRSAPSRHSVSIAPAGRSVIRGRVTGDPSMVSDIQLVRRDGRTAIKTTLEGNGRYSLQGVPPGEFVIFVNDAKREARVTPTSNLSITVDGRSAYTRDFVVR